MIRVVIAAFVLCVFTATATAQTCTPEYTWGMTPISNTPENNLVANANTHHAFSAPIAPPGKVARLRTVSMSTYYNGAAEYMIEHLVNVTGGHHYHEIARGQNVSGTPVLHVPPADLAADIFYPGERLAGRALGGTPQTMAIFVMWSGWLFPEACLPRLLGVEQPPIATGGTGAPPPDFSALATAAQAAASALTGVAQSVP